MHIPIGSIHHRRPDGAGVLFLMAMFARLYAKPDRNEALVVYGFRGTRIVKGRGTLILPMMRELSRAVAATDVVRCRAAAGSLYQAGRRGHRGSGRADQGEVAIRNPSTPPPSSSSPRAIRSARR